MLLPPASVVEASSSVSRRETRPEAPEAGSQPLAQFPFLRLASHPFEIEFFRCYQAVIADDPQKRRKARSTRFKVACKAWEPSGLYSGQTSLNTGKQFCCSK